jgi:hypothetical protein
MAERPKGMQRKTWKKLQAVNKMIKEIHERGTYKGKKMPVKDLLEMQRVEEKSIYKWGH